MRICINHEGTAGSVAGAGGNGDQNKAATGKAGQPGTCRKPSQQMPPKGGSIAIGCRLHPFDKLQVSIWLSSSRSLQIRLAPAGAKSKFSAVTGVHLLARLNDQFAPSAISNSPTISTFWASKLRPWVPRPVQGALASTPTLSCITDSYLGL